MKDTRALKCKMGKISKKSETDGTFSMNVDHKRVDYFYRY